MHTMEKGCGWRALEWQGPAWAALGRLPRCCQCPLPAAGSLASLKVPALGRNTFPDPAWQLLNGGVRVGLLDALGEELALLLKGHVPLLQLPVQPALRWAKHAVVQWVQVWAAGGQQPGVNVIAGCEALERLAGVCSVPVMQQLDGAPGRPLGWGLPPCTHPCFHVMCPLASSRPHYASSALDDPPLLPCWCSPTDPSRDCVCLVPRPALVVLRTLPVL
jgi:hypothetical protein